MKESYEDAWPVDEFLKILNKSRRRYNCQLAQQMGRQGSWGPHSDDDNDNNNSNNQNSNNASNRKSDNSSNESGKDSKDFADWDIAALVDRHCCSYSSFIFLKGAYRPERILICGIWIFILLVFNLSIYDRSIYKLTLVAV